MFRPAAFAAWLVLFAAPAAAQAPGTSGDRQFAIEVALSTSEIPRTVSLVTAAGQVGNRAADAGLDRLFGPARGRGTKNVLRRIGQMWFVNVPIASLAAMMSHNTGHFARAHEHGLNVDLDVTH